MPDTKRLIIVDISSFIFRAFYAVRELHSPDGVPVNAVHGVLSMLLKLLSTYRPTHIFLARDSKGPGFRHEIYPEYKANRSAPPEELVPQFALIETLINKMKLPTFSLQEYEADDLIGSAVVQWKKDFDEILIATGDKDLMQFVDEKVKLLDTMKDIRYGEKEVFEKMGVWPNQIVDYLSLIGDSSDNIPGMKGIGAKGAAKLLEEHKTLEACIKAKDTFTNKRLITAFNEHLDEALLSKKLVTIVTDVELGHSAEETRYQFQPTQELLDYLKSLGMRTLLTKVEEIRRQNHYSENESPILSLETKAAPETKKTEIIQSHEEVEELLKLIGSSASLGYFALFNSDDPVNKKMMGFALSHEGKSFYVPLEHQPNLENNFINLSSSEVMRIFQALWQDSGREIAVLFSKNEYAYFQQQKIKLTTRIFDLTQAHFVIDPGSNHQLDRLSENYLAVSLTPFKFKQVEIEAMSSEAAAELCSSYARVIERLHPIFTKHLEELDLKNVFETIDNPLQPILSKMEQEGIRLNIQFLKKFEGELSEALAKIDHEIQDLIKEHLDHESFDEGRVNLRSPKQLSILLFEKLNFPVIKKTKTGYSTDSEVMEALDAKGSSPIPRMILDYRELEKLLGTYVKAFPDLVNPKTGKIHTHFLQHVAATGRLASQDPNLQNIPIRSELGRKMRKAFIAGPGNVLLSADYSQVELRILAHFASDETMIKAFHDGVDIHRQTAAEVLGKRKEEITSDERSMAKAVNFGLMYGQSSFGLAAALKISRQEAKDYITKYFSRFGQVKAYLDSLKDECEKTGYAITYYGRKRFLPDITSQNRTIKAMAERVAVNSPIQGTAADIIKKAMINIDKTLEDRGLKSRMILQVHDELIFEVPEEEINVMKVLVREGMEGVVKLKVPLQVDMSYGVNWYDLK